MQAHHRTPFPTRKERTPRFAARMLPNGSKRLGQRARAADALDAKRISKSYLVAIGYRIVPFMTQRIDKPLSTLALFNGNPAWRAYAPGDDDAHRDPQTKRHDEGSRPKSFIMWGRGRPTADQSDAANVWRFHNRHHASR